MLNKEILLYDALVIVKNRFDYVLRMKYKILFFSVFFSLMSFVVNLLIPIRYTATYLVINENTTSSKLDTYASLAELAGIDIPSANVNAYDGENIIEFIKGSEIIRTTLLSNYKDSFFLDVYLLLKGKPNSNLFINKEYHQNRENDSICNKVILEIQKKLTVEKMNKKNDVITIQFTDQNEQFAFYFLYKLLENVSTHYKDYKTQKNYNYVSVLNNQVDSIKKVIHKKLEIVASKSDKDVNLVFNKPKVKIFSEQQLLQSANVLYNDLLKNLQIAKINLLSEKPFLHIIESPKMPLDSNKKSKVLVLLVSFLASMVFSIVFYFIKSIV